jgi:formylglycine-generating enzyme required for sulfatase activity
MGGLGRLEELGKLLKETHIQLTKPFAIARYETTFDEYDRFAQATGRQLPSDQGWGRGRRPVINLSWDDAKAYTQWLSQQTGKRYRLPTESEWEYAARSGGKDEIWAGTSDEGQLENYAVYGVDGNQLRTRTEPVGSKKPNGLGLYDMSGNVWELVKDCWHEDYQWVPTDGSASLNTNRGSCDERVIRGGAWSSDPTSLITVNRFSYGAGDRGGDVGLRLAQDIP